MTPPREEVPARRSIARTALLLLPVQIVFRTGEAIVPLLLAAWFGRTPETDAYYLAWAFFTFAGALVASAYQDSALIPVLTEVQARDQPGGSGGRDRAPPGESEYARTLRSLLGLTLAYASALGAAMGVVALGVFRWRYEGALFATAAALVPSFAAYLVALALRALFVGALNQRGRYFVHPVASGAGIVVALGAIALGRGALGVRVLPLAWLAGEVVAALVAGRALVALVGAPLSPSLARPEPVRRFFRLVASEVVGSAITRINPVVDQMMAALSPLVGAGTVLRYAFDVASLPTSAAQATVFPVLLSHLSEDAAGKRHDAFDKTVRGALLGVCGLLAAMCLLLGVFRGPILRLVFLHGAMDEGGIDAMAEVLPYALLGVAPFGALLVLARAHVALQNSRIMVSMGILNAVLNAVFDVVFFQWIGLRGIALSTSAMNLAIAVVFWVRLRAKRREAVPAQ
jgi:putative peptidoglycan lipid II flippase